MIWSVDPFATFKATFRLFSIYITIIVFFIHYPFNEFSDNIIKVIIIIFLLTSFIAVLLIPGATDPDFNTWRGLSPQKNIFGQVCLLTFILSLDIYLRQKGLLQKTIIVLAALISIILLFGSQSSTSIIGFVIFVSINSIRFIDGIFRKLKIGRLLSSVLQLGFIVFVIILLIFYPELLDILTSIFGKDTTFTGRTELWLIAYKSFLEHFPLGTGLGAFWNPANKQLISIHLIFPWLPMQAHSGILDTLNEAGIVGFLLFIGASIKALVRSWMGNQNNLWFYLFLLILILNSQETTILIPGYLATTLFFIVYVRIIIFDKYESKT